MGAVTFGVVTNGAGTRRAPSLHQRLMVNYRADVPCLLYIVPRGAHYGAMLSYVLMVKLNSVQSLYDLSSSDYLICSVARMDIG